MLHKITYLGTVFIGQTVTGSIGYIDNGGTCLDSCIHHSCQILVVCAAGILGIELNLIHFL